MAIVTDGLVLYLHGACGKNNPATRVWKDLSGNGNDGELVNFGYIEDSGWVDGGLRFDGVDDYVQLPELALNPDNFTIQVDDKIRAFNGDKVITENGDEWGRNLIRDSDKFLLGDSEHSFPTTQDIIDLLNESDYVTASVYVEVENAQPSGKNRIGYELGVRYEDGSIETIRVWVRPSPGENIKGRFSRTFDLRNSKKVTKLRHHGIYRQTGGDYLKVGRPKLEKGPIATLWTPAPEDITETNIINHTTPFVENNTIHTLRLYNRALTDEEIIQNYQAGHEWTPQIGKREATTTMKPITASLSRKGTGRREVITTVKPITTSLERKGVGKREVISTMKPITSELNRKGVGRREVITTMQPITSSISKKLPPIHADMDIREHIPKLEVD